MYIPPNWRSKFELLTGSESDSKQGSNDRFKLFDEEMINDEMQPRKMIEGENIFKEE